MLEKAEPQPLQILGNPMRCEICDHDRFYQREGMINTAGMTFLELDWLNRSATCVICSRCGYVHWFLPTR